MSMSLADAVQQVKMIKMSKGAIYSHKEESCNEAINVVLANISETRADGEWFDFTARIDGSHIGVKCNRCGTIELTPSRYCPYCGAKMQKHNNGTN